MERLSLLLAALAGGKKGLAELPMLSGLGLMGGAMLRDLAIVATAFGGSLPVAGISQPADSRSPMALLSHDGLAGILPRGPGAGQFRPVLFACSERFF